MAVINLQCSHDFDPRTGARQLGGEIIVTYSQRGCFRGDRQLGDRFDSRQQRS